MFTHKSASAILLSYARALHLSVANLIKLFRICATTYWSAHILSELHAIDSYIAENCSGSNVAGATSYRCRIVNASASTQIVCAATYATIVRSLQKHAFVETS